MFNLGPVDLAGGNGIPLGVNHRTAIRQATQADIVCNGAKQRIRKNPGAGTEFGDKEGHLPTRPVYHPDLSPQEGRIAASSRQLEASEPFDGKMQIQNGERENIEGPGQEE